jgi:zinc transporter ZupT
VSRIASSPRLALIALHAVGVLVPLAAAITGAWITTRVTDLTGGLHLAVVVTVAVVAYAAVDTLITETTRDLHGRLRGRMGA